MMSKEYTIECPHCGNETQLEIKHNLTQTEWVDVGDFDKDAPSMSVDYYYYVLQCKTCGGVVLYGDWELDDDPGNINQANRLYPIFKQLSGVPKAIKDAYEEAKKIEKRSPTAFAVLIRRALEYLCRDKGGNGNNLKNQIDDLASKNIIPPTLARMAGALRYFGNLGAHSNNTKIGIAEAQIMDEFFIAVIEYVYIAPSKINQLVKSIQENKNS